MMNSLTRKWALTPFLFLTPLVLMALAGCASNPTGGTNFVLHGESWELKTGKEEHEKLMKTATAYQNDKLQALVNKVGQRLAAVSDRPNLEYHFTVIDSDEINAFALPGGYVYAYRGLLDYLSTESQLAAVLGHEIGHIAARHSVRRETANDVSNVVSTTAAIASVVTTGTTVLGETASLFGGALVSGYGRDMELEADGLGANYLQRAGYDPKAMVEVITILKNQEDFSRKISKKAVAYHGLFATHPRNDTRLQQAVAKSTDIKPGQLQVNPQDFRDATSDLLVGPPLPSQTGGSGRNHYYNKLLNYTLILPDGWKTEETVSTMTATAPAGKVGSLKIEAVRLQQAIEPRLYIRNEMKIADLQQAEALQQYGLDGYTGINPATGERVAVIYYARRMFVLTGTGNSDAMKDELGSIKTFRGILRNEGIFADPMRIGWIQADGKTTYADLARQSRLPEYPEEMLRLMNGDYPAGQPAAGKWIKIVK